VLGREKSFSQYKIVCQKNQFNEEPKKMTWTRMLNPNPLLVVALLLLGAQTVQAQSTAFTYQGKLTDGSNPASGPYDFQIKLFDTQAVGTGAQQGTTVTVSNITVTAGIFTVPVDFGVCPSCFNGASRFLEIAVKPTSGGTFTTLGPRQPLTSTPYAIRSLNATTADGLSVACLSCITSSQIQSVSGSAVTGTIPVASLPAGSASYIQNTTTEQASANFNISDNGTAGGTLSANVVNATTQYNLGGLRAFTVNGPYNDGTIILIASNTFAGDSAGMNTAPSPTLNNSSGKFNSFFGAGAGKANTGANNAFFGDRSGFGNTTGVRNAFFGSAAGRVNMGGSSNSFFGTTAGESNSGGSSNSFFGDQAGYFNQTGHFNSFFGFQAGVGNTTGGSNTLIGNSANVSSGNLDHATAIGAGAVVTSSNMVQIGRIGVDRMAIGAFASSTSKPVCINGQGVLAGCAQIPNPICINANGDFIACASSLRYKSNVHTFPHGMALLRKLRPVAYTWKEDGRADVGLIAEEVAEVEPLLTIYNNKGEIEGVKYAQLSILFINAFKEQQTQLEQSRKQLVAHQAQITGQGVQLARQQRDLEALKQLLCQAHPRAKVCQSARRKK
jgi:hypothetical protein